MSLSRIFACGHQYITCRYTRGTDSYDVMFMKKVSRVQLFIWIKRKYIEKKKIWNIYCLFFCFSQNVLFVLKSLEETFKRAV